jgi:hypothetical protein
MSTNLTQRHTNRLPIGPVHLISPQDKGLTFVQTELIMERVEAQRNSRFGRADQIRTELFEDGIVLQDRPNGAVSWYPRDAKVHTPAKFVRHAGLAAALTA